MEMVNGFRCANCTDVDYAKKHIDPAHPKDGPYGINAKDPSGKTHGESVVYGGVLEALRRIQEGPGQVPAPSASAQPTGPRLDLRV